MQRLALVLLAALAGCQPWYRDAEIAGRRVSDSKATQALIDQASAAYSAGDAAGAVRLMRQALERNPMADVYTYGAYSRYLVAAGKPNQARAVLLWRMSAIDASESPYAYRDAIVETYLADDLTAAALGEVSQGSLAATVGPYSGLSSRFGELVTAAAATSGREALTHLRNFVDAYGCADHAEIDYAVASAQSTIARDVTELADVLARADAAVVAGDAKSARLLYAEAYRVLPPDQLAAHADGFKQAAAAAGEVAEADPIAYGFATEGDAAIKDHHVGAAIHAYRRAVAEAPWWRTAHENLARLLDLAGLGDFAQREREFVAKFF